MKRYADAVYAIHRGDTDWTLLYYGTDFGKIHHVYDWAMIHCAKTVRVRGLSNYACCINNRFFRTRNEVNETIAF